MNLAFPALSLLVAATLAAGCAQTPAASKGAPPAAAASADCRQLDAEITRTRQARDQARQQGETAWQAVLPFAVAARYASSQSAAGDAGQRLDTLQAEFSRLGCSGAAG